MSTQNFFKTKTDWARRKHLIVSYYLDPAIKKLRYASPDRRVFILDGFAGRGKYEEDGAHGSPIYTGNLAEKCREGRDPLGLFIRNTEPDTKLFKELEKATASWVEKGFVKNLNGTFQETLPQVLKDAGISPLFAFLDPFKPSQLVFNDFLSLLYRQAKTEVCAVFFTRIVQRHLQALRPTSKSTSEFRSSLSQTMTRVLGGPGWQDLVAQNNLGYEDILHYLARQIKQHASSGYSGEPGFVCHKAIYSTISGHMKYHIVFWTRHVEGLLLMNDAFVKEAGDLEEMTESQIALAAEKKLAGQILFDLDDPDQPSEKDIEAAEQFKSLCQTILDIGKSDPSHMTRSSLIEKSIMGRFGEFSRTKHRKSIQAMSDKKILPKIIPVNANQNKKTGNWTLNEDTILRFEFD